MSRSTLTRIAVALTAALGLTLSWSAERRSLERANRVHRAGASVEAAALYQQRATAGAEDVETRYNLGTAMAAADAVILVVSAKDAGVMTRPKVCEQISSNEMVLFGQKGKKQRFATITFKN